MQSTTKHAALTFDLKTVPVSVRRKLNQMKLFW